MINHLEPRSGQGWRTLPRSCVLLVGILGLPAGQLTRGAEPPAGAIARLEVFPPEVTLKGIAADQRLIVVGRLQSDDRQIDLTREISWTSADPRVATIVEATHARPISDGRTELRGTVRGREIRVPITVVDANQPRVVSFRHQIIPILTRLGCNMGACHGSQHGKGGFKLSLLGFEPEVDYISIVKTAEGRRVAPSDPDQSLLLLKPTVTVAHAGGLRLEPDSPEYRLLTLWIEQGTPPPDKADPVITRLQVFPTQRSMEVGDRQSLVAMATFSDGAIRDVTDHARFNALNDGTAKVDLQAVSTAVGKGETNILARYQGRAALAMLTVPYTSSPPSFEFPTANIVDQLAATKWRQLGLSPSPLATDSEFLRRAMLDLLGTMPTPDEHDAFVADNHPNKREKLIDDLLGRPEYVDYWTLRWGDILRVDSDKLGAQGMLAFNFWLRAAFRENRPFDRMVQELVTAQGSLYSNGPSNYFRVATSAEDLAETTAQVFMGVRLQCARCHHHPFEAYGQDDYYGLAAYFRRVRTKSSDEHGIFGREQVVFVSSNGEQVQPRTGKTVPPTPLNDKPSDDPVDRRRALARWLTRDDNPWLARNVVNRYWGYLFGKGLVNPIDDLRETNPATNPELLDGLARKFIADKFDLKSLVRTIMTSRVYQLSSLPTPDNRQDATYFTHYPLKRLSAETLLDALNHATGTTEKFDKRPVGTRAISLPDTTTPSYFLDTFGRPERAIACECERTGDPTLSQALHLMNGDLIQRKLLDRNGRLARLLRDPKVSNEMLARVMYKVTFVRDPDDHELAQAVELIGQASDRSKGVQDLLWGLINSKEFFFNH